MKLKAFYVKCFATTAALLLTLQLVASHVDIGDGPLKFDKMDTHDKAHIKDHLDGEVKANTADMTDEELEFHYFKLHDYDGNNKLDGLEIALALKHHENSDPNEVNGGPQKDNPQGMSEKEVIELVDSVLLDEDLNNDGYVDYHEFVSAQRRSAENEAPPAPPESPTAVPPAPAT
ncbi:multiple coagulation factor deficiency protein 2 homolog [Lineus longissimus]|uniref:multiple coagulation factor deficiency protein 2 homolog n=1 Tax=Lineus longissimus TaxID=88925 RepID=UPI00315D841C